MIEIGNTLFWLSGMEWLALLDLPRLSKEAFTSDLSIIIDVRHRTYKTVSVTTYLSGDGGVSLFCASVGDPPSA